VKRVFVFLLLSGFMVAGWTFPVAAKQWYRVRWVADGDTIFLQDGRHIRFIGINAPEVAHKEHPAEPFGDAAKNALEKIIDHHLVRLEWDEVRRDRYGRHLAYVFDQKNHFLSRMIVAKGLAHVLYYKKNRRYFGILLKTQQQAMAEKTGFWKTFQPSKTNESFVGNRRSLRFHAPNCPEAKKIYWKNRVNITTAWSAFKQGYAPAKGCLKGIGRFMRFVRIPE
jgi:micrococcal nuclease